MQRLPKRHTQSLWVVGTYLAIAFFTVGGLRTAVADSGSALLDVAKVARAHELIEQQTRVVADRDYARAASLLEQAYRVAPLPEIYFYQGRLFRLQGRAKDAADCYHRYLDSVPGQADVQMVAESKDFLASFREATTEILVSGESDALLYVDGRFLGGLPLPGPLLTAAGPHRFRLEKGGRPYDSDELTIPGNQRVELRITPGSQKTAITVLTIAPAILLLLELEQAPEVIADQVWQRISTAARDERSLVVSRDKTRAFMAAQPDAAACGQSPACQESVAKQADASLVLTLHIKGGSGYQINAQLFDALPGAVGATFENRCSGCDLRQLLRLLPELTGRLLRDNAARQRGTLEVTSTPSGAAVSVDGRVLGTTPYQRETFTGPHEVLVGPPARNPEHRAVTIEAGQVAQLAVQLSVEQVAPPPTTALTRPRWRLIAGAALLGTGVLVASFGIAGLAVDGRCGNLSDSVDTCPQVYNTAALGGGLLGGGLALAITGTILLALPAKLGRGAGSK